MLKFRSDMSQVASFYEFSRVVGGFRTHDARNTRVTYHEHDRVHSSVVLRIHILPICISRGGKRPNQRSKPTHSVSVLFRNGCASIRAKRGGNNTRAQATVHFKLGVALTARNSVDLCNLTEPNSARTIGFQSVSVSVLRLKRSAVQGLYRSAVQG